MTSTRRMCNNALCEAGFHYGNNTCAVRQGSPERSTARTSSVAPPAPMDGQAKAHVRYHVTASANVDSILAQGLVPGAGQKNFATGRKTYLATSADDARRWAREIARENDEEMEMTLLEVSTSGVAISTAPPEFISIGVAQSTTSDPIEPGAITVVETFTAVPQDTHGRYIERSGSKFFCGLCLSVHDSSADAYQHAQDRDEMDEWDD